MYFDIWYRNGVCWFGDRQEAARFHEERPAEIEGPVAGIGEDSQVKLTK